MGRSLSGAPEQVSSVGGVGCTAKGASGHRNKIKAFSLSCLPLARHTDDGNFSTLADNVDRSDGTKRTKIGQKVTRNEARARLINDDKVNFEAKVAFNFKWLKPFKKLFTSA